MTGLYTHGGALLAGALLAFVVQDWRYDAEISRINAEADKGRAIAAEWVIAQIERNAQVVAESDKKAIRIITDANKETERLRDCIDRGAGCGLRVNVIRANQLPAADKPSGVGTGDVESAELSPDARRAYFTLPARIPALEQALKVCVSATQPAK